MESRRKRWGKVKYSFRWTSINKFDRSSPHCHRRRHTCWVWLITRQDLLLNDSVWGSFIGIGPFLKSPPSFSKTSTQYWAVESWSRYRHEWQVRSTVTTSWWCYLAISGEFIWGTSGVISFFEQYSLTVVFRNPFMLIDANPNEMMNLSTGTVSQCRAMRLSWQISCNLWYDMHQTSERVSLLTGLPRPY